MSPPDSAVASNTFGRPEDETAGVQGDRLASETTSTHSIIGADKDHLLAGQESSSLPTTTMGAPIPSGAAPEDTSRPLATNDSLPSTDRLPHDSLDDESKADEMTDTMASSVATLRPNNLTISTDRSPTQYLSPDTATYIDPTPPTPLVSEPPSPGPPSPAPRSHHSRATSEVSPTRSDAAYDEKRYLSEDEQETRTSRSEIQSIMEQFGEDGGGPDAESVMSPRLEIASPLLGAPPQHPPRKSSLEPLAPGLASQLQEFQNLHVSPASPSDARSPDWFPGEVRPPVPPKDGPKAVGTPSRSTEERHVTIDSPMSPTVSLHRPPPPEPEPEPTLPFDFHRFLEQLRNKKADPVARYLKSFLSEFSKRQWMVHEQVKIVSDFLAFIANKMAQCEVWRDVSDSEFDNAREGMEKLVMNRLYSQTFSPAIPSPQPITGPRHRQRGSERLSAPGRRGQHQEDVERDGIVTQKINIYGWVREDHLDIPPVNENGRRFLKLAQQELLKIRSYRAPRDKIICVLNCCKVIFGLLKNAKSDTSADSFMPLLIYVVLQANPEHLVSNVQYILRFRNQEKLGGEAGYYLSSLMGAIQFVEGMDRTTLTISDEEFERNVEASVSAIAEKHLAESPHPQGSGVATEKTINGLKQAGEASISPTRWSSESGRRESSHPRRSTSTNDGAVEVGPDDQAAITGLLRTIQKPLTTIGRIFSDEATAQGSAAHSAARSPAVRLSPLPHPEEPPRNTERPSSRHELSAEEAAARQASAEAAEAQRLHRVEHANIVETLAGMFPDLDKDLISDVVYQKEGRVGLAVDACLALSS